MMQKYLDIIMLDNYIKITVGTPEYDAQILSKINC